MTTSAFSFGRLVTKVDLTIDKNTRDVVSMAADNFLVLKEGTDRLGGEVDTDAFEKYFATHSPVSPGPQNRITQVP